jgi:hypothetical protein
LAKCRAERAGLDTRVSELVQWSRDPETGHFWRITQEIIHNLNENTTKKSGKPVQSENLYKVSNEDDYDYVMEYTGWDGNPAKMYLKELVL